MYSAGGCSLGLIIQIESLSRKAGSETLQANIGTHAYLSATRGCFEAVEIYPPDFVGIYGVVRDQLFSQKKG